MCMIRQVMWAIVGESEVCVGEGKMMYMCM